jgi:hypothetical protein
MTLTPHEFIRRFLTHVLPGGFHRIRHYGLLASGTRAANIARARELLAVPARSEQPDTSEAAAIDQPRMLPRPCPCCGGRMFIIETFARGCEPKHRPTRAAATISLVETHADGQVNEISVRSGDFAWLPGAASRSLTNVGATPLELLEVELK